MAPERSLGIAGHAGDWQRVCASLPSEADDSAARAWFERYFTPYEVESESEGNFSRDGLFTGYYEPQLQASRERGGAYQYPIYKLPDDFVSVDLGQFRESLKGQKVVGQVVDHQLRPYPDRAAIEAGALANKGYELFWATDPVDVFFLEIQGSGQVILPDGQIVGVGYAGQNGHEYIPIGQTLISRGFLERQDVSMPAIRAWLAQHPDQTNEILATNPSVVFFRQMPARESVGGEGVPLTPGRSLAIDKGRYPYGLPMYLDTTDPVDKTPLRRLVVAQDTGGAIKGVIRGDLFWGAGPEAAQHAGLMKQRGKLYLLLPNNVTSAATD